MFVFEHGSGQNFTKCTRAVSEPMLASHFGEDIIDPLFAKYNKLSGNGEDKAHQYCYLLDPFFRGLS